MRWGTKKIRISIYGALVIIGIGILIYSMRTEELVGAPERGARGDTVSGETIPTFE